MAELSKFKATALFGLALCAFLYVNDDNPNDWVDQLFAEDKPMPAVETTRTNDATMSGAFSEAAQGYSNLTAITSLNDHPLLTYIRHAEHQYQDVISGACYKIACGRVDVSNVETIGEYKSWRTARLKHITEENNRTIKNNENILTLNKALDDGSKFQGRAPHTDDKLSKYNQRTRAYNAYIKAYNKSLSDGQQKKVKLKTRTPYSAAFSAYQFVGRTMESIQKNLHLPDNFALTPNNIDAMAMHHITRKLDYNAFLHGDISIEDFAQKLANEWAGIPQANGKSVYHGYNGNKASSDMTYRGLIRTLNHTLKLHRADKLNPRNPLSYNDSTINDGEYKLKTSVPLII